LEYHRFARFRGRYYQSALAEPEGTQEIDDPVGVVRLASTGEATLQREMSVRVDSAETSELGPPVHVFGWAAVYLRDLLERRALIPTRRLADLSIDLVSGTESVAANDPLRHEDVARGG
jgi:hypothetical protein